VLIGFLIPTKNRPGSLDRTLRLVRATAAPTDDIIVCDQSLRPSVFGHRIRVLHRPELSGLPAARNALLAESTADVVCFLDDDTDLAPDFAARLRELAIAESGVTAWGPAVEFRPKPVRWMHRAIHYGVFHDPRRLVGRRTDQDTSALYGCCFAVRRHAAISTGFDGSRPGYALGEDLDFFLRLPGRKRFAASLRAIHRRDGADRADPARRGQAKGAFLVWLARRHGRRNPVTVVHLAIALAAAATRRGDEPASLRGLIRGIAPWLW
jgi:glycosyltransferase involved in cell wall biosynthesis